jgi:DNA-binding response OmpR family regulator
MAEKSNDIRSIDMTLDASEIRLLVVESEEETLGRILKVLKQVLVGGVMDSVSSLERAEELIEENNYNHVVLDLRNDGYSNSELVKALNNSADIKLIAFCMASLDLEDEENIYRLDPVKKLFEAEKPGKKNA